MTHARHFRHLDPMPLSHSDTPPAARMTRLPNFSAVPLHAPCVEVWRSFERNFTLLEKGTYVNDRTSVSATSLRHHRR